MPHVSRIIIYPVKSLEGVAVASATITPAGALDGDRVIAMFDERGKFINGKKHSAVHLLRSEFAAAENVLHLRAADGTRAGSFSVERDQTPLETWLSEYFGFRVKIDLNHSAGFPDDTDAPGPTIISTATLIDVAGWFPTVTVDSMRQRFRANVEIAGVPAFWEDRLYGLAGTIRRFQIGSVLFEGTNPCQRCAVPPRDPLTGEGYPGFSKTFMQMREQTLPAWAERSRFNHFYRLAINTKVPADQVGKVLRVGDEVKLINE